MGPFRLRAARRLRGIALRVRLVSIRPGMHACHALLYRVWEWGRDRYNAVATTIRFAVTAAISPLMLFRPTLALLVRMMGGLIVPGCTSGHVPLGITRTGAYARSAHRGPLLPHRELPISLNANAALEQWNQNIPAQSHRHTLRFHPSASR